MPLVSVEVARRAGWSGGRRPFLRPRRRPGGGLCDFGEWGDGPVLVAPGRTTCRSRPSRSHDVPAGRAAGGRSCDLGGGPAAVRATTAGGRGSCRSRRPDARRAARVRRGRTMCRVGGTPAAVRATSASGRRQVVRPRRGGRTAGRGRQCTPPHAPHARRRPPAGAADGRRGGAGQARAPAARSARRFSLSAPSAVSSRTTATMAWKTLSVVFSAKTFAEVFENTNP